MAMKRGKMIAKAFWSKIAGVKSLTFYVIKDYSRRKKAGGKTYVLKELKSGVNMYVNFFIRPLDDDMKDKKMKPEEKTMKPVVKK